MGQLGWRVVFTAQSCHAEFYGLVEGLHGLRQHICDGLPVVGSGGCAAWVARGCGVL